MDLPSEKATLPHYKNNKKSSADEIRPENCIEDSQDGLSNPNESFYPLCVACDENLTKQ